MIPRVDENQPEVFRLDVVQAAARAALEHEPIDAIAAKLGVAYDTVLRVLRFPAAPYLAAMNMVDNEDAFGMVYDLKRLRAYNEMLIGLPEHTRTPLGAAMNETDPPALSKLNMRRIEVRLSYLLDKFAGETCARSYIESLLQGMTEGAGAEECREVVDRFIAKGKLRAADEQAMHLLFPG